MLKRTWRRSSSPAVWSVVLTLGVPALVQAQTQLFPLAPIQRQRGAGARELAARTAGELAGLVLALHGALVEGGLAEAGLVPEHAVIQPGLADRGGRPGGPDQAERGVEGASA